MSDPNGYVTKDYADPISETTSEVNVNNGPPYISTTSASPYISTQPAYGGGPGYQHTVAPPNISYDPTLGYQQSFDPWVTLPPIGGLDELCDLLGIVEEPTIPTGSQGPVLTSVSGKRYALVNILRGQMEFMSRLNMLLIHRQIVPESE
jgi:hypothetical protein